MQNGKQSDEQYLKQLYERFVGDVMNNINSEFYDENELLDIFDYAQDEGDDLTQMYVLLSGARLFPDSKFLDERKAFFLAAVNDAAARKMLERKGLKNNALWEILRLTLGIYPEGCDIDEAVRRLLASDYTLSCEAVIRIIDWLHDIDRLDILVSNLEIIAEKSETPDIFYYEAAEVLSSDDFYMDIARNIAEDLTSSQPFNADNWILLAKIEFSLHNLDECLSAIDYALAIDPESERGMLVKAIAYVAYASRPADNDETPPPPQEEKLRKERIDESTVLLKKVLLKNDQNALAIRTMAEALVLENLHDSAVELLKTFMSLDSENSYVITDIMRLHPKTTDDIFEIFNSHNSSNERIWIDTAGRIESDGNIGEAVAMLEWFHSRYGLREGMEYMLTLLYRSRRYARYIALFASCCEASAHIGGPRYEFSTMVYLMLAAAHLMEHNFSDSLEICNLILSAPPFPQSIEEHIRWKGIQVTVSLLRNLAESKPAYIDDPDFDPLCFKISSAG